MEIQNQIQKSVIDILKENKSVGHPLQENLITE